MSALYALVLAAGLGSRFGGRKLLSPWRGGVLLDGALAVALDSPAEAVFLVIGSDGAEVASAAQTLAQTRGQANRLRIVEAADFADGLSASLRAGLAALPAEASGVLVFLGDMPVVPRDLDAQLAQALAVGALASAPIRNGQRGNPVGLSSALFAQLTQLTGDKGARAVLDGLGAQLTLIPTEDDGVLIDVDRPGEAPA
ncbi:MAG TPA: nucleotidyltransferase family protein [Caulobacteraceae bacterium]|nr:nucleotidyltransferase family protein [Caulobacteraceae bacterium]